MAPSTTTTDGADTAEAVRGRIEAHRRAVQEAEEELERIAGEAAERLAEDPDADVSDLDGREEALAREVSRREAAVERLRGRLEDLRRRDRREGAEERLRCLEEEARRVAGEAEGLEDVEGRLEALLEDLEAVVTAPARLKRLLAERSLLARLHGLERGDVPTEAAEADPAELAEGIRRRLREVANAADREARLARRFARKIGRLGTSSRNRRAYAKALSGFRQLSAGTREAVREEYVRKLEAMLRDLPEREMEKAEPLPQGGS